ncbi:FkbM family methyltransferase [Peribacillus sp. NPDC094092]|uniref:FkbM family methyltransferase n=1 Tax=Peribacillus sp. NPDC094092 TaxID=3390611 RepID=UPI003D01E302
MGFNTRKIQRNGVEYIVNDSPSYQGFWNSFSYWEIETFQIFDRYLNAGSTYLDIGAWIGPTVLYGAQKAKHVYAIEPDPIAYQELTKNLKLNDTIFSKVTCINSAMSEKEGNITLFKRNELGDSMSSILPTRSEKDSCEVRAISINELIRHYDLSEINFIKMDIEAGEYFLIPSISEYLKNNRPTLNLSIHPPFLFEAEKLKLTRDIHSGSSYQIEALTKRILESLEFYKYIYDPQGNLTNKDEILNLKDNGMFIFTDEPW